MYDNLGVSIHGLTSKEIVDYAIRIKCPNGHATKGKQCSKQGRPVCNDRFTLAVKKLSSIAIATLKLELSEVPKPKDHGKATSPKTYTTVDVRGFIAATINQMYETGSLTEHSKGFTYIVVVNRDQVKIGHTVDVYRRLQQISRDHGTKVLPLAILKGGYTKEMCVQHMFRHNRVPVTGELFTLAPDILDFANSSGFCPESKNDLDRFASWIGPRKSLGIFLTDTIWLPSGLTCTGVYLEGSC